MNQRYGRRFCLESVLFHNYFPGREHFAVAGNGVEIHAV